jgi:hypothetical protein
MMNESLVGRTKKLVELTLAAFRIARTGDRQAFAA